MSKQEFKIYAVKVYIKPPGHDNIRYQGKTYKGIVFANNPEEAKEKSIQMFLKSNEDTTLIIGRSCMRVTECKLYNDFAIK